MVTIQEVAERAGVSISTVSNVLNKKKYVSPQLKERVYQAVKELDYVADTVAKNMKRGYTKNIGVITSDMCGLFYPYVLQGIYQVLSQEGYHLTICDAHVEPGEKSLTKEQEAFRSLFSNRVDGVIFVSSVSCREKAAYLEEILREAGRLKKTPLVSLERDFSAFGIDSVYYDNRKTAGLAVEHLIEKGCRSALPGEYTQRAFLNGKMDLSQAEAVADLIASTSAGMHKLAINQMRGGFSNELTKLRSQLLDFTSLIELELDFSEEDVEFADRTNLKQLATGIEQLIRKLADSFSVGNAIKNGIPVAIIGETNAGKSTLLNLLVGEERAIVSDIHGTTRDVIEDTINLSGVTFRFIDTAGIRETNDTIESLGIERTFQKLPSPRELFCVEKFL